jgi:hypothetical protein
VSRTLRIAVPTALLLLLAGLGVAFLSLYERREEEVEVGYRGWARVNPYLAAERFLRELGVWTASEFRHGAEPSAAAIVMLLIKDPDARQEAFEDLETWLDENEATLVVFGDAFPEGVSADRSSVLPEREPSPTSFGCSLHWSSEAEFDLALARLAEVPGESTQGCVAPSGEHAMLWEPHGRGDVLLIPDASFMRNERIGEHDHAAFLWWLVQGHSQAVLVLDRAPPSLPALLWAHAWPVVVSLVVLLLAWLSLVVPRFGPITPPPAPIRRRLLEHVEAAGAWRWRMGHGEALLSATRAREMQRLHRRHPHLSSLEGGPLIDAVTALAGRPRVRVAEALYGQPRTPRDFLRVVRTLRAL